MIKNQKQYEITLNWKNKFEKEIEDTLKSDEDIPELLKEIYINGLRNMVKQFNEEIIIYNKPKASDFLISFFTDEKNPLYNEKIKIKVNKDSIMSNHKYHFYEINEDFFNKYFSTSTGMMLSYSNFYKIRFNNSILCIECESPIMLIEKSKVICSQHVCHRGDKWKFKCTNKNCNTVYYYENININC